MDPTSDFQAFLNWLSTPGGSELLHALTLLITAIAAYVGYRAHETASSNAKMLNHHLDQHILDAANRNTPIEQTSHIDTPPTEE